MKYLYVTGERYEQHYDLTVTVMISRRWKSFSQEPSEDHCYGRLQGTGTESE